MISHTSRSKRNMCQMGRYVLLRRTLSSIRLRSLAFPLVPLVAVRLGHLHHNAALTRSQLVLPIERRDGYFGLFWGRVLDKGTRLPGSRAPRRAVHDVKARDGSVGLEDVVEVRVRDVGRQVAYEELRARHEPLATLALASSLVSLSLRLPLSLSRPTIRLRPTILAAAAVVPGAAPTTTNASASASAAIIISATSAAALPTGSTIASCIALPAGPSFIPLVVPRRVPVAGTAAASARSGAFCHAVGGPAAASRFT